MAHDQSTLDIKICRITPFSQQRTLRFPLRSFGKTIVLKRSFQSPWFHCWKRWVRCDA